ncbi:MAG: OpgC domain-containing protein [Candidatus Manganitrophus sp.]|nr:OpgC domain-containing protein [Candidatus Manganitrophus sp.]
MYTLLMLITPFVIRRYQAGKRHGRFAGQFFPLDFFANRTERASHGPTPRRRAQPYFGYFDFFAWQFLFILGTWLGFTGRTTSTARLLDPPGLFPLVLTLDFVLLLARHQPALLDSFLPWSIEEATEKSNLGWLRLINVLLIAYLIGLQPLFRWRWFAFLGEHSLPVFTYHIVMLYLFEFFVRDLIAPYGAGSTLLLSALFILSLALPAWLHRYYSQRKSREAPVLTYRGGGELITEDR